MNNQVSCPVCGSDKLSKLYCVNSSMVSDQLLPFPDPEKLNRLKSKIEEIWLSERASFYTCQTCSFDFADPFIAGDAELYSLLYSSEGHYPSDKWEYTITLAGINRHIESTSRIPKVFEIGAGNGSFLKIILKRGIPADNIIATEYSDAATKAIENLGVKCHNKNLNDITSIDIPSKVDIVCLFQVLEHLTDVRNFFSKIAMFTNPGGKLYISVPNFYQRRFFDSFGFFFDLPPIHVGRYNSESLGRLANNSGWSLNQSIIQTSTFRERVKKFLFAQFERRQRYIRTENIRIKILKLLLRYSIYLLLILRNIRLIAGLRKQNLGTAQWFELERTK